ncbi:MAG: WGR domain-containing protein [Acidiphilium sp.]|nr:WGR domain-containing protein [Acidiphilium sp.]MDD4936918.1 WGR domain-containing protein [Acidiphilium sp.]
MIETPAIEGVMLELRACAPEKNRFRSWRIEIDRDLFGLLNARITFGRIGTSGRTRRWDFDTEVEAAKFLRAKLRRRASGDKRRGAAYRVIDASAIAIPFIGGLLPLDRSLE